ncbi:hypothetical protein [Kaistella sp.]|uniref:hypothetical protein n=1 Tax=Kaistella sp. TaxID=2782235 RepID=UPI003C3900A9
MKKIITSLSILSCIAINAQNNFSVGVYTGIPVMDANKKASINIGAQASYLRDLSTNFKIGASVGYSHYFIKKIGGDHGFYPIAAKAQYTFLNQKLFADLDLGYAIPSQGGLKGGLYAHPKIGYKIRKNDLFLGFQSITAKYNFDYSNENGITNPKNSKLNTASINIGYNYNF